MLQCDVPRNGSLECLRGETIQEDVFLLSHVWVAAQSSSIGCISLQLSQTLGFLWAGWASTNHFAKNLSACGTSYPGVSKD